MRVTNINSQISFGKVIKVKSTTNPIYPIHNQRVDTPTYEVERVLNSKPSKIYTKEEQEKIREFFRGLIDDYNGRNGVMLTRSEGSLYLVSGKDVDEIRQLQRKEKTKRAEIKANFLLKGYNRKMEIENTYYRVNNEIKRRAGEFDYLIDPKTMLDFRTQGKSTYDLTLDERLGNIPINAKIDEFIFTHVTHELSEFSEQKSILKL